MILRSIGVYNEWINKKEANIRKKKFAYNPLISIVVPVYNAERYLQRCVDSIIRNTFLDWELILVDDGSEDDSGNICESYSRSEERIKVLHQGNGGQSIARNNGLQHAQGRYITFVDADDEIASCADKSFSILNRDYDMVAIPIYKQKTDGGLDVYGHHTQKIPFGRDFVKSRDYLKGRNVIPCVCAYLWRKEFLESIQLKFRVGVYHEDVEFTVLSMIQGGKLICDNSLFSYRYIIRNNSITTTQDKSIIEKRISDFSDIINRLKTYYSEHREIRSYLRTKLLWLQFDLMRIKLSNLCRR